MRKKRHKPKRSQAAPKEPAIRDRIKELRRVPASQIVGAPWNWRTHPDIQVERSAASIEELGFFDPLDTRELPDGKLELAAGLSSFQGNTHHQSLDLARHPEKSQPTSKKLRAKDRPLTNDFLSDEEFERLLHAWFGNLARVLLPRRCFYVWGGYANLGNYPPVLKACGLYFSQGIVWDKEHPVLTGKDFMGCFEIAFYGWRQGAAHPFFGPNNARDLWHIKKVNPQNMIHLTEKPVELARTAMEYSSMPGENVLDLFAGSGSTLIAAEQAGRQAFLMELDPLYCDVIVQRLETFTGHKAQRVACAAPVQSLGWRGGLTHAARPAL